MERWISGFPSANEEQFNISASSNINLSPLLYEGLRDDKCLYALIQMHYSVFEFSSKAIGTATTYLAALPDHILTAQAMASGHHLLLNKREKEE